MDKIYLLVPFAPLVATIITGLFCRVIPRWMAHTITIAGVAIAFICSVIVFYDINVESGKTYNEALYTWMVAGDLNYTFEIGFLIDALSVTMMLVVTFVSLMVHIYTIGYMRDDPGYNRFFCYISLFTFSMLMLVMSNNFIQLFFGWEAVGLVSYLLIGFWYTRPTATYAGLKAFLVNRVGDLGFILGIGLILAFSQSLDYTAVFKSASALAAPDKMIALWPGYEVSVISAICILLFIGAMGKSAQIPLHVWLPDSMEGPTPISALIHAATMVTAGIFMVARMSPLFEFSDSALSFVMIIGAITALSMGLIGIVQNDIKRVVAYSTLSQLGYMTVALGASAYSAAIFHLMTHAFFKALLFLAAGSVIIALHHDQDIRNMGGLYKYMKITWVTALVGSLALIGTPLFAGFYSKDTIIEAVHYSNLPGSGFAYVAVLLGVAITAFYTFRMFFLVFHGNERFGKAGHVHGDGDHHHVGLTPGQKPHESPWVVTLPLMALAFPSFVIGFLTIEPMLYGGFLDGAIVVNSAAHPAMATLGEHFSHSGPFMMVLHALISPVFWLAVIGVAGAWFCYLKKPELPALIEARFGFIRPINAVLENKFYFDKINDTVFAAGARRFGQFLWRIGDVAIIDNFFVNGTARMIGAFARISRCFQSGYLYQYAFTMIIGVLILLSLWFVPLWWSVRA